MSEKIGFVGLGEMGLPMAINLQQSGYQVCAFDINQSAYQFLEKQGIVCCKSVREAAENSDNVVISMVRNAQQTESVIFGENGITSSGKPGLIIIVMSTLDFSTMSRLAERVEQSGYQVVDAPVSGAKSGAEAATLTIMTAGRETVVQQCYPYFKAMGKNIFYFGSQFGSAQAAKLANNLILAINMVGCTEGLRFAEKYNLPTDEFLKLLSVSTGNSWVVQNWETVRKWWENYQPNTTLDIVYKDLLAIIQECSNTHFSLPLGGLTFHLLMTAWGKKEQ
jgi:3-hydroxyisobutyrate dehydrogenase